MKALAGFAVYHSHIVVGGRDRSEVTKSLDGAFYADGWREKKWETKIVVDDTTFESPTHKVDCGT